MARNGSPSISRRRRGSKRADGGVLRGSGQSPVVGAVVLDVVVLCRPPQTQRNAAQRSATTARLQRRRVAVSQRAAGGCRAAGPTGKRQNARSASPAGATGARDKEGRRLH